MLKSDRVTNFLWQSYFLLVELKMEGCLFLVLKDVGGGSKIHSFSVINPSSGPLHRPSLSATIIISKYQGKGAEGFEIGMMDPLME